MLSPKVIVVKWVQRLGSESQTILSPRAPDTITGDDIVWPAWKHAELRFKRSQDNIFARAIPFTRKYEDLAQVGARKDVVQVLSNDHAKVFDTAVEAEFDACGIRYVGTGTAGGAFTTNGTATLTCTSQFNKYHCKQMVDYMFQTLKCEPYDGDHYMSILTTDAKRGIYDDVESMLQYTKYPASGEFGRYYDCRFVKTNHAMSNAMGASSAYGEGYMFGAIDGVGPVQRGVAVPVRIIPKEVTDYQRSLGLTWYAIEGFKITHDSNSSPDRTIIKYTSA